MESTGSYHKAVMIEEVVRSLACKPGGTYVDGTVGGGGHARGILEASSPDGILIGIDRDDDALSECGKALEAYGDRKILVRGNFAEMEKILAQLGIERVDGIVLDLGVSSHQLDRADRGFSFTADAPLDMRMDRSGGLTARDLVNELDERQLGKILRDWGEERKAARIARAIAARRRVSPIETTGELASVVAKAAGTAPGRGAIHPATRTFQALRIAVNDELENLRRAARGAVALLKKGGRLSILSFHSLEDRIVKETFRSLEKGCVCPADFPVCSCGRRPEIRVLTRKPLSPSPGEIDENPRARSAKLRTAEKV